MRKQPTRLTGATLWPRLHRFRRGVSCFLLLLVTYSVAAESLHHHGQLWPAQTVNSAAVDNAEATGAAAKLGTSDGVCLLCQFQQQLAHGLVQVPAFACLPLTRTAFVVVANSRYLQTTQALPGGRAPPLTAIF